MNPDQGILEMESWKWYFLEWYLRCYLVVKRKNAIKMVDSIKG